MRKRERVEERGTSCNHTESPLFYIKSHFDLSAQMDMSKSAGFRAVEELLKAQKTHMSLRKQFEEARLSEMTLAHREVIIRTSTYCICGYFFLNLYF